MDEEFRRGDWGTLLGRNVRVYYGSGAVGPENLMVEGEVVGYCEVPTLVVRARGITHHVSTSLPIEVQNVAWVRL